jgi:hypothetical protein
MYTECYKAARDFIMLGGLRCSIEDEFKEARQTCDQNI